MFHVEQWEGAIRRQNVPRGTMGRRNPEVNVPRGTMGRRNPKAKCSTWNNGKAQPGGRMFHVEQWAGAIRRQNVPRGTMMIKKCLR